MPATKAPSLTAQFARPKNSSKRLPSRKGAKKDDIGDGDDGDDGDNTNDIAEVDDSTEREGDKEKEKEIY